jgi:RNA polymerase sigma factor (sigma-70 family)
MNKFTKVALGLTGTGLAAGGAVACGPILIPYLVAAAGMVAAPAAFCLAGCAAESLYNRLTGKSLLSDDYHPRLTREELRVMPPNEFDVKFMMPAVAKAYSILQCRSDAEEIAAEVVHDILTNFYATGKPDTFKDDAVVYKYLETSVKNKCRDLIRRRQAEKQALQVLVGERQTKIGRNGLPADDAFRSEIAQLLKQAVESLEPQLRDALQMQLKGYTLRKIAKELGIPIGSVKTLQHRARGILRERLNKLHNYESFT